MVTEGGHRRYPSEQFIKTSEKVTILYARVSSRDQKDDLDRQCQLLQSLYPSGLLIIDLSGFSPLQNDQLYNNPSGTPF